MCTAITINNDDFYFGRNLDLSVNFGQKIVFVPRNYTYPNGEKTKYAILGMANIIEGYPGFADAFNEHGLSVALLYFPGNAKFFEPKDGCINIASYDFINYILRNYKNTDELKEDMHKFNITAEKFNKMDPVDIHWMVADQNNAYVFESTETGLNIYENKVGVLTNNPPFPFHMENLKYYMACSNSAPKNNFSKNLNLRPNGEGFGMLGIPGDTTPLSRFVKTAFLRENSYCNKDENSNVVQIFRILDNVSMVRGSTYDEENRPSCTIYTSCISAASNSYFYKTYDNLVIKRYNMSDFNMDDNKLSSFDLDDRTMVINEDQNRVK